MKQDAFKSARAKLFKHGGSQAVRLPKEFRMPGEKVRLTKVPGGILIEPDAFDSNEWLATLRQYQMPEFMEEGREQPDMPPERPIFD